MTFIDALNNEETRSLVEQIEEIGTDADSTLMMIRANLIAELATFGFNYK